MARAKSKKKVTKKGKESIRKSKKNPGGKKKGTKSKDLLDINDSEMDKLLTEFAEEEKKNTLVKIDENDDEFDSLVEEFAISEADCKYEQTKSTAKVVLSSDNEIDELLDGFEEEDLK